MDTAAFTAIANKALQAFKASEAAKKARELVRRKSVLVKSTLPGKLADCSTTDLAESEIFVVEGDSAGVLLKTLISPPAVQQDARCTMIYVVSVIEQ